MLGKFYGIRLEVDQNLLKALFIRTDHDIVNLRFVAAINGLHFAAKSDSLLIGLIDLDLDDFFYGFLKVKPLYCLAKLLGSNLSNSKHILHIEKQKLRGCLLDLDTLAHAVFNTCDFLKFGRCQLLLDLSDELIKFSHIVLLDLALGNDGVQWIPHLVRYGGRGDGHEFFLGLHVIVEDLGRDIY